MNLWIELRVAARRLLTDRWFTLAAVLALALGIAATNTVFTVLNAVLLRPLPVTEAERLVDLGEVSYLEARDWAARARTLAGIAVFDERSTNVADDVNAAERFIGGYISANTFDVVRQRPALGRDFRAEDDRIGAPPVVILGHQLWTTRYRSDPGIVGRTIRVNGVPTTVVGVMPDGFAFPQIAELWQPVALLRPEVLNERGDRILAAFGRLRSDASAAQAQSDLTAIAAQLAREYPASARRPPVRVATFRSGIGPDTPVSVAFSFMMGAVAFVLLIACANVANLLLARSAARAREVAVRMSIGASRWQIVRQLLVESVLLAVLAGVVALGLSLVGLDAIWLAIERSGERPPYWLSLQMDERVFTFLLAVCLATSMLAGLAPAWVTSRVNLLGVLVEGGGRAIGSVATRRWTSAFVIGQLALALVLLTGAGLMIRSLMAQVSAEAGVDLTELTTARLDLPGARFATPEQRGSFYRQLEERFASMPGMRVSYASEVPLDGAPQRQIVTDALSDVSGEGRMVGQMTVGAEYFATLGTRPVRGRTFRHGDPDGARVAVVNERLAEMYFAGTDAIGQRLRLQTPGNPASASEWLTVVGVAPNVRQRSTESGAFDPLVYVSVDFNSVIGTNVIARSAAGAGTAAATLRQELAAIDGDLPLFAIGTVDERLAAGQWAQRFTGSLFSIFAGVALLLAALGLYAVTAYTVSQRTREIGLRVALGAQRADVWKTVTAGALRQLAIGLLLGIGGGVAISRVLPSDLTGTAGSDPLTFAAVAALLVAAALIASSLPVRRALKLDPMTALRTD
jgi:putative ABC transport system permease protein